MRKTKEILRLRWSQGLSLRETALSCGVGPSTVHDLLARATAAGLSWPLPADLDDAAREARLYPPPPNRRDGVVPNFQHIYRELKRRGVTPNAWQLFSGTVGKRSDRHRRTAR